MIVKKLLVFFMYKLLDVIPNLKYKEFIRCFIFDNFIEILHINNENKVVHNIKYNFIEKENIFKYLDDNKKIPVELILYNKKMNIKSIDADKVSSKDIRQLVKNELISKSETINSIAYEEKSFYKNKKLSLCDMNLNPVILKIIEELFSIKNFIISFSCWPIWIISSYFTMFNEDKNKFKLSVFVIKNNDKWEIISLHNEKIVSYRKGDIESFNEKIETEATINYLSKLIKIDSDDIAIYKISQDLIDKFNFNSISNMRFTTKTENLYAKNTYNNINLLFKTVGCVIFFGIFFNIVTDIFKIFNINSLIKKNEKIINSENQNLIEELALWKNIDDQGYMNPYDFEDSLSKYMQNKKYKRLKEVSLNVDKTQKEIGVNIVQANISLKE